MSFVPVLTILGRTGTGDGPVAGSSHAALRTLMVLPTWPLRGWAGVVVILVLSGTACVVVLVALGTGYVARSRTHLGRPSTTFDHGKGRTESRDP